MSKNEDSATVEPVLDEATRPLFDTPIGSHWSFDVELIARYLASAGSERGLSEAPVRQWTDVGESHVRIADFVGIHYLLAQLVCSGIVLVTGYLINRVWTFAAGARHDAADDLPSGTPGHWSRCLERGRPSIRCGKP